MTDTPAETLDTPFHLRHWPRAIDRPAAYDGGERLVVTLPLDAVSSSQRTKAIAAWAEALPTLSAVRWLRLSTQVTPPLFEAACRMPQLECFSIKWSNLRDLAPLRQLGQLRQLFIGSSTRVESIAPIADLASLEWLELENFKKIDDFAPLERLTALRTLAVTGDMWTRQDVGSLEPFGRMTWLRHLVVDTAKVTSLHPLAPLVQLETLGLGGRLPMAEYAWLAAKLPHTRCQWFRPWLDLAGGGFSRCAKCGGSAMAMLTGKGAPTVCRACDAAAVARHEAAFEAVRQAALAEG
jgi:hypothetical protein